MTGRDPYEWIDPFDAVEWAEWTVRDVRDEMRRMREVHALEREQQQRIIDGLMKHISDAASLMPAPPVFICKGM